MTYCILRMLLFAHAAIQTLSLSFYVVISDKTLNKFTSQK